VVLLHDTFFTSQGAELLGQILKAVPSACLEVETLGSGSCGDCVLPITSFAEESDFVVNHDGELRRYQKALQPPRRRTVPAWVKDLAAIPATV